MWILFFLFLCGCQGHAQQQNFTEWEIQGRMGDQIYKIQLPRGWEVIPTVVTEDTRAPLLEAKKEELRLVVHNFPEMAISPQAQVLRWRNQLPRGNAAQIEVTPCAWSGYEGLCLEAPTMIAWALSLSEEHQRQLFWREGVEDQRAPVTIKCTGPSPVLEQCRDEVAAIALSFELIHPFEE